MRHRRDHNETSKLPAPVQLLEWVASRPAAPERNEIDPAAIRGLLADMLMIDVQRPPHLGEPEFPIRLSGTRVNALFGVDLKGRCLSSLWRLKDRQDMSELIRAVLDDTRPAVAGVRAAPPGDNLLTLELLLLPLRHKGKTHARLLGVLSPAAVPSWLGVAPVAPLVLGPFRMVDPQAAGRVPEQRSPLAARERGERHGHFVIYQGGRL